MARRRNAVTKNFKDYLVPIVGGILVLFFIINLFTGGEDTTVQNTENRLGIMGTVDTSATKAVVVLPSQERQEVSETVSLFKGETLVVNDGSMNLDIPEVGTMRLGKLGELKYNINGSYTQSSGIAWYNLNIPTNINMKFARVSTKDKVHISLNQNEVSSTIYVIDGNVEVTNLAGKSILLLPGEKISILQSEANSESVDLRVQKEDIDDLFIGSDWFAFNKGASYFKKSLEEPKQEESETTSDSSTSTVNGLVARTLIFDSITDESSVNSDKINITGKYVDESIVEVTLNGKKAELNTNNKTFTFKEVELSNKQNDLIFRAIDDAQDVLEKRLITLYNQSGADANSSVFGNVRNYDNVDASQFTFTAPSKFTTYTTEFGEVTIQGQVLNKEVASVKVNGYQLKSFSRNSGTWKYHAFERFNTLKAGTNVYEVKYFDADGKLIFTNNYTIVRKTKQTSQNNGNDA